MAERQFGVFTHDQALRAGLTDGMIRRRLASGRWTRLYPRVYLVAGSPLTLPAQTLAAVWAAGGACASFESAACLWGFFGIDPPKSPHVSLPDRKRVEIAGIEAHRPTSLTRRDMTRQGVIPVTTPLRTTIDLSGHLNGAHLEQILDDAIRRALVDPRRALIRVRELKKRGRVGLFVLENLLQDREHAHVSGSPLEAQLARLIRIARLPVPEREFSVVDSSGQFIARVDFAYPREKVAIEVDGFAYHDGRKRFDADRLRHVRLIDAGWLPLTFSKPQVVVTPDETISIIRRALRKRHDLGQK